MPSDEPTLFEALSEGDFDIALKRLDKGADIEAYDSDLEMSVLMLAAWEGAVEVVRKLLDLGAVANRRLLGETALTLAAEAGQRATFELLEPHYPADVVAGARARLEIQAVRHTAAHPRLEDLIQAIAQNHVRGVAELLREGVPAASVQPEDGFSCLHFAVFHRQPTIVRQLLLAGADPEVVDDHGDTPLTLAVRQGADAEAGELLAGGASPNHAGGRGCTPLMCTATAWHSGVADHLADLATQLLEAGAEINAQDARGRTALAHAARSDRQGVEPLITRLLQAGADRELADHEGRRPIDHARHLATAADSAYHRVLAEDFLQLLEDT